jgi:mRNA-degrading endonuclease toxin of MazEF toxin-antitoxin module
MNATNELLRGSVWSFRYLDDDEPKPVVIVSNDGRNRSRFEWVHVECITTRPKRSLPTVAELSDRDADLGSRRRTAGREGYRMVPSKAAWS